MILILRNHGYSRDSGDREGPCCGRPGRLLLTGWFRFRDGEATAGDVPAERRPAAVLDRAGLRHDTAWSPGFRPGGLSLESADPGAYDTLLFVCGPVHRSRVAAPHDRFRSCRRAGSGVTVVDPAGPAVTGFDEAAARDGAPRSGPR